MITVIKILTWLASPIGLLCAFSIAAALLHHLKRFQRVQLALVTLGIAQLLFFAWPPVAAQLTQVLENKTRALQAQNTQALKQKYAAILLLGGGITPALPATNPPIPANANEAIDRVIEAARLYHQGLAPLIIVTGGNSLRETNHQAPSEADAMKDLLILMGVPETAIRSEDRSLTTRQNMAFTAARLKDWGVNGSLALVTSATHMPRAYKNAVSAGLSVDVCPTDWSTPLAFRPFNQHWLPNAKSLEGSERTLKEWVALIASY